jgi:hypothetical protein
MASAAARAPPLDIRKPQTTKTNDIRRMVKINVDLSPNRQQFAILFFVRVPPVMRLARPFFKMVYDGSSQTRPK